MKKNRISKILTLTGATALLATGLTAGAVYAAPTNPPTDPGNTETLEGAVASLYYSKYENTRPDGAHTAGQPIGYVLNGENDKNPYGLRNVYFCAADNGRTAPSVAKKPGETLYGKPETINVWVGSNVKPATDGKHKYEAVDAKPINKGTPEYAALAYLHSIAYNPTNLTGPGLKVIKTAQEVISGVVDSDPTNKDFYTKNKTTIDKMIAYAKTQAGPYTISNIDVERQPTGTGGDGTVTYNVNSAKIKTATGADFNYKGVNDFIKEIVQNPANKYDKKYLEYLNGQGTAVPPNIDVKLKLTYPNGTDVTTSLGENKTTSTLDGKTIETYNSSLLDEKGELKGFQVYVDGEKEPDCNNTKNADITISMELNGMPSDEIMVRKPNRNIKLTPTTGGEFDSASGIQTLAVLGLTKPTSPVLAKICKNKPGKPEIRTSAEWENPTDKTKPKTLKLSKNIKETGIIDTVTYKNLTPKKKYRMEGALMCNGEKQVEKATSEFTPETANGTTKIKFTVKKELLEKCHNFVVFEKLWDTPPAPDTDPKPGTPVASHEDPKDKDQTVTVEKDNLKIKTVATWKDNESKERFVNAPDDNTSTEIIDNVQIDGTKDLNMEVEHKLTAEFKTKETCNKTLDSLKKVDEKKYGKLECDKNNTIQGLDTIKTPLEEKDKNKETRNLKVTFPLPAEALKNPARFYVSQTVTVKDEKGKTTETVNHNQDGKDKNQEVKLVEKTEPTPDLPETGTIGLATLLVSLLSVTAGSVLAFLRKKQVI